MGGTRLFEAYAAMSTHTDDQVGRLLDALEDQGELDNTLAVYILGDNGASAEAGYYGTFNEMVYQNSIQMTTGDIIAHLDDDAWELYGPDDWTQAHDIAATDPEKLQETAEAVISYSSATAPRSARAESPRPCPPCSRSTKAWTWDWIPWSRSCLITPHPRASATARLTK
jgi:hypothetical protein